MKKYYVVLFVFIIAISISSYYLGRHVQSKKEENVISPQAVVNLVEGLPDPYSGIAEDMYKNCYANTYLAHILLKEKKYTNAKFFLRQTLGIKKYTPKHWKSHSRFPLLSDNFSLEMDPIESDCKNRDEVIGNYLRRIRTQLEISDFENAFINLNKCIAYEKEHPSGRGNEEGVPSCRFDYNHYISFILKADCCGFLNIMHSKKISYEKKKELIDKLHEMIKKEHDKK